tara:strand:+ start:31 stop:969 length:939 start_codon:yes stop_codon:yes gene_type:complete
MKKSLTIFKSQFDNKTEKRVVLNSFDALDKLLFGLSQKPKKGKKDAELISPAIYKSNTTRANTNVSAWAGWCAIDVDDYEFEGVLEDVLRDKFGQYRYVCYSTASSTRTHPKFRLVFDFEGEIGPDEIRHFWYAINKEFGDIGDSQTKDLSRMYYIPADYAGAYNFYYSNRGNSLDHRAIMAKYPYDDRKNARTFLERLPVEVAKQIVEYRKSQLQNTNYSWSSYTDCPFVNKRMISEYRGIAHTDNSGRYAMIYKIMCSIASNAVKKEYPIQTAEIVDLIKQLDADTSRRYEKRPLIVEADRAVEYAYRNL